MVRRSSNRGRSRRVEPGLVNRLRFLRLIGSIDCDDRALSGRWAQRTITGRSRTAPSRQVSLRLNGPGETSGGPGCCRCQHEDMTASASRRTLPGWALDEVDSAGRENLDAQHVARYDAKEDAGAAEEVVMLQSHGLDSDARVVDLGAGTGQFTLAAAPVCTQIVAVDVSPIMLARLRAKVAEADLRNVEVVEAGFLSYEREGPPTDLVYSRLALHHLPDFWKGVALQRIREVLAPGGVFRLSDVVYHFDAAEAEERIEAWCATAGAQVDGEWTRAEYEEHVRDEHSTYTWLLEPMIERAGFAIEQADYADDGIFAHYLASAT